MKNAEKEEPVEIIDLVDKNDVVIRQVERNDTISYREVYGGYVRVVDCYIMNSEGQLWVPVRTENKRIAPNGFDLSVGEHMQQGETYEEAIVRGFVEEVGFAPDLEKLEFLGTSQPQEVPDIIDGFFIYHSDDAPELNLDDFVRAEWLAPDELLRRIESGHPAKANIAPLVRKYRKSLV